MSPRKVQILCYDLPSFKKGTICSVLQYTTCAVNYAKIVITRRETATLKKQMISKPTYIVCMLKHIAGLLTKQKCTQARLFKRRLYKIKNIFAISLG